MANQAETCGVYKYIFNKEKNSEQQPKLPHVEAG
jgi:hypothetical protein